MPEKRVKRPSSGRVTPKKAASSGRYTPPIPKSYKQSPRWVPIAMGICLGLGMMVIILNYLGLVPGETSNVYLAVGLALITAGFVIATQWR
jgi:hypothetical protein